MDDSPNQAHRNPVSDSDTKQDNDLSDSIVKQIENRQLYAPKSVPILGQVDENQTSYEKVAPGQLLGQARDHSNSSTKLAYRIEGTKFCKEQEKWHKVLENEENENMLRKLRWAIRLRNWVTEEKDPDQILRNFDEFLQYADNQKFFWEEYTKDLIGKQERWRKDLESSRTTCSQLSQNLEDLNRSAEQTFEDWYYYHETIERFSEIRMEYQQDDTSRDESSLEDENPDEHQGQNSMIDQGTLEAQYAASNSDAGTDISDKLQENAMSEERETIIDTTGDDSGVGNEKSLKAATQHDLSKENSMTATPTTDQDVGEDEKNNQCENGEKDGEADAQLEQVREVIKTLEDRKKYIEDKIHDIREKRLLKRMELSEARERAARLEKIVAFRVPKDDDLNSLVKERQEADKSRAKWQGIREAGNTKVKKKLANLGFTPNDDKESKTTLKRIEYKEGVEDYYQEILDAFRSKIQDDFKDPGFSPKLPDNEVEWLLQHHSSISHPFSKLQQQVKRENMYTALEGDEFRLLVLAPAPNCYHPLIAGLTKVSFCNDPSPSYAAISYCWDPEKQRDGVQHTEDDAKFKIFIHPETISGSSAQLPLPFFVGSNLFCALHRLRRPDKPIALWVDALCISQSNNKEKAQQIKMMNKIFSTASQVCIWLGESDEQGNSDLAMDFIPHIVDRATLNSHHATDENDAEKWLAVSELIRDPWFSRRWIVQEISLARYASVHCGTKNITWNQLVDAIALLIAQEYSIRKLFVSTKWRYGQRTLGEVQHSSVNLLLHVVSNLFQTTESGEKAPLKSLEYLVTKLQSFEVTTPHDMIHSLRGIARGTEKLAELSYDDTPLKVYKDFVEFCITSSGSLDIICRPWAKNIHDKNPLPSWIRDRAHSEFGGPGKTYKGRQNGEILVGEVDKPHYQACGDTIYEKASGNFFEGNDETTLHVKGFVLNGISAVSPRNTVGFVFKESIRLGGWQGFEHQDPEEGVPDIIWRTLVADRDPHGDKPPLWYRRACWLSLELADIFNNGDLSTLELSQDSVLIQKFLRRVQDVTSNRSFFAVDDIKSEEKASQDGKMRPLRQIKAPKQGQTKDTRPDAEKNLDSKTAGNVDDRQIPSQTEAENTQRSTGGHEKPDEDQTASDDQLVPTSGVTADNGHDSSDGMVKMDPQGTQRKEASGEGQKKPEQQEEQDQQEGQPTKMADNSGKVSSEMAGNAFLIANEPPIFSTDTVRQPVEPQKEKLKLYGICPPETKKGDLICFLQGCSVPVIMRHYQVATDSHFELIGEAYVYGKMNGEAINDFIEQKKSKKKGGKSGSFELLTEITFNIK
ncbi:hypothetical protein N7540_010941 [Penicillium herquei]|nr:hypothetical protein N7540_010941 [Penicillium herquei]